MHEPFSPLVKNTRRVKRLGKKLGSNKGLNKQTDFQNQDTYILFLSKTLLFLKKTGDFIFDRFSDDFDF